MEEFEVVYSATASNGNHFFVIERHLERNGVEIQQSVSLWSKELVEEGTTMEFSKDEVASMNWTF